LPHGFRFAPHLERVLSVEADRGEYHAGPEWCMDLEHDLDRGRGQAECPRHGGRCARRARGACSLRQRASAQ
jgi:hypothetical protein